jgi:uncharacterized protein (TIGR00369 family)
MPTIEPTDTTKLDASKLDAWLANETAIKATTQANAGRQTLSKEQVLQLPGIELLRAMMRGEFPFTGIGKTLDFYLAEVSDGSATFQGSPGPAHFNPLGGIHGGWYATLLDSAMGCAVHSKMPVGRGYTTAELSVNLVRAIPPKVSRLRAEGKVIHCGRQLATAEGRLLGPDGTIYAHGTTTCLVFEYPSAKA